MPLVLVTGPAGIGRSTVLAQVGRELTRLGTSTVDVPMPRRERDVPHLLNRLGDELGAAATAGCPLRRLLAALEDRREPLVVFLDDAHRIGPDSGGMAAALLDALAGSPVTLVCAARTPASREGLDTLRKSGLVHEERLRPLNESEVDWMLDELLHARPAPEMTAELRRSCRGNPAMLRAAVEALLAVERLRIVDRHVHLVDGRDPRLPSSHPLFAELCEPKSPTWSVLKALAALHPLGEPAPGLVAECTGLDERRVTGILGELGASGVLLARPWRFRIPMLAAVLLSCLGPYERRRAGQVAVRAIRAGAASCADPSFLPDRLMDAGAPDGAAETARQLLEHAAAMPPDSNRAELWRWAAVKLLGDFDRRAEVLHEQAMRAALRRRFRSAVEAAQRGLDLAGRLPPEAVQELQIIRVVCSAGNTDELREFVRDGWRALPGTPGSRIVTRAAGLCLLNRWQDAHRLLAEQRGFGPDAAPFAEVIAQVAVSLTGVKDDRRPTGAGPEAVAKAYGLFSALALCDGNDRLAEPVPDPAMGAAGRWDRALHEARRATAIAAGYPHVPEQAPTFREMAAILTARGQLSRAHAVLEHARSRPLLLPHLLAIPASDLESTIGAHERARASAEEGLALAAEGGVLIGTDELWLRLAEWESVHGTPAGGEECASRAERVARRLGTVSARRNHLLARVLVERDEAAAREAVDLARQRDRPFEFARTVALVAERGLGAANLVRTAYEIFGELDALIPRARLRLLMRAQNIAVPGRNATLAENERLLATLVTEGLTNSQTAVVLGTSEKSVEGRLTRFFQRHGYRSRAELATAMLHHRP
ncbi:AAA family ATPase [Saccharopolyspora sp. MS10]|uniref:AAA family ATPase n=1 Tax=Saccharopolyspora sp. MS10 TaxID=3385973 RepID=UPI0039A29E65